MAPEVLRQEPQLGPSMLHKEPLAEVDSSGFVECVSAESFLSLGHSLGDSLGDSLRLASL